VAIVKRFLEALPADWVAARADRLETERMTSQMAQLTHAAFELHAPAEMVELGAPAVGGRPWFEYYGEWLQPFATYRERFTEFIDAGPGVVLVHATIGGTTVTDGVEITREAAGVYRLEDGLIRSISLYFDRDEARAAAGLV